MMFWLSAELVRETLFVPTGECLADNVQIALDVSRGAEGGGRTVVGHSNEFTLHQITEENT